MAAIFQLRRGTTANKPTLSSGEFYMDTDTESLYLGIDNAGDEIVLAKLNDSNTGNFIIAGNLTVGGTITAPIITNLNGKFDNLAAQSGAWDASTDITLLNAFTSSQNTKNSTLETLTGSIDSRLTAIETISNSWVTESETASFFIGATVSSNTITFTKGNGTTADVTVTGGSATDISALNQHSSSINSYTSSQNTKNTTLENVTSSLISFTGSVNSRLTNIESTTASLNTKFSTLATQSGSWVTETESGSFLINASVASNTITFTKGDNTTFDVTVAGGGSVPAGTVSGSAQITAFGFVSGSYETTGRGIFSGSSQITGFETTGRGIISGAAQLPTGIISGAAQLPSGLISGAAQLPSNLVSASSDTATIDMTITAGTISAVAIGGIVSGSSQLTGALDLRYVRTGSFNSYTQSINSWTSSTDIRLQAISDLTSSIGSGGSSPISVTGTSLKSDTPLTSNVSTTNGIFFGKNAGKDSTAAARSIFLGEGAGNAATNANDSIFIGSGSGENAANAIYSTMLGYNAGFGATNANGTIFIGTNAGASATDAGGAIFLGDSAGFSANNAAGAFFVGANAGWAADNAIYSNFIGNLSGQAQTNAAYSNLIGYRTGYVFPGNPGENLIGPNNIIIGTGITLQNGRQDSINIGGLIFGTGSYDGSTTQGFSGSANGKVGINIPLPQAELHVSGSGIYTGTLTASLSEGYVWAGGAGNVSKLVATSSFGGGGGSTDISALNTFTSSANSRLNNLELDSASQDNRLDNLELFTSSIDTTIKTKLDVEGVLSGSAQITAFGFISSSTIQTSGSTIYSTNPATTNFTQTDGVFIGYEAGVNSTAGDKSVFVGYQAGWSAANAYHSNFIGQAAGFQASGADRSNFIGSQAGDGATNARFSNFIGFSAGYGQTAASYSNVFGYRAGYTNTLGSNNIIIGTNITFENNRKDSINLGGVIFATGSHSNTVSSPFAGAVTDGKVGINMSLPQAALHVSGAAILTNTFTASLSEGYTWVGGAGNVTTLVATSSFGGGGGSTDITLLNQHTASINTYTGSVNTRLNNLELDSASQDSRLDNLELFTGSTNTRLNAIESVSGAWITESETGSFELRGNNIVSASTDTPTIDITITAGTISAVAIGGIVSGSSQVSYLGITDVPQNIVSGATQIVPLLPTGTVSGSSQVTGITNGQLQNSAITIAGTSVALGSSISLATITGGSGILSGSGQLGDYETTGRGIVSSSTQVIELLPVGTVSGSTQVLGILSSLNSYTQSNDTTNTNQNNRLTEIENYTSSLKNAIGLSGTNVTVFGDLTVNGTTTQINSTQVNIGENILELNYGGSAATAGIYAKDATGGSTVSGSLLWDSSTDLWIAGKKGSEAKVLTDGMGVISGSGQLGDYETTGRGIISSSAQITTFGFVSGSYVTTSSFNNYTASISTASLVSRLDAIESTTSSLNTYTSSANNRFTNIELFTASTNSRLNSIESVSGSWVTSNITGSSLVTASAALNVITFTKGNNDTFNITIDTGSFGLPAGVVSGSSQLTASYDTRYELQGSSIVSGAAQVTPLLPTGTVSGSSQVVDILSSLNSYTQSNDTTNTNQNNRLTSLESATSSLFTSASLGLVTASYAGTTLTFTKGDTSQFSVSISTGSAETASLAEQALDVVVNVKNTTGAQINKGTIVRVIGATGDNPLIQTASWENDASSANTLGWVMTNIPNDGFGRVLTQGVLLGVNTDGMSSGQMLYLSSSGQYTNVKPPAPYHEVRLGQVLRVQQNNGSIFAQVQNGYELEELHDVDINTASLETADVQSLLSWNSSSQQWVNKTVTQVGAVTTGSFNTLSSSVDSRLDSLESFTSSIDTTIKNKLNTETVVSSSAQITSLGFISSSVNEGVNFYYDPLPSTPTRGTIAISASATSPTDDSIWVYVNYGGTLQWKEILL